MKEKTAKKSKARAKRPSEKAGARPQLAKTAKDSPAKVRRKFVMSKNCQAALMAFHGAVNRWVAAGRPTSGVLIEAVTDTYQAVDDFCGARYPR